MREEVEVDPEASMCPQLCAVWTQVAAVVLVDSETEVVDMVEDAMRVANKEVVAKDEAEDSTMFDVTIAVEVKDAAAAADSTIAVVIAVLAVSMIAVVMIVVVIAVLADLTTADATIARVQVLEDPVADGRLIVQHRRCKIYPNE